MENQTKHIATFLLLLFLVTESLISNDVPTLVLAEQLNKIQPVHPDFNYTLEDLKSNFPSLPIDSTRKAWTFLELADRMLKLPPEYLYLVDKNRPLSADFYPNNLKALAPYGILVDKPGMLLDSRAHTSLMAMSRQAINEDIKLIVVSAYRTRPIQQELYTDYLRQFGERARQFSAAPGHSQHHLGTAVDFQTISNTFANTKASNWLLKNAGRYGWSLSYPKGHMEITGYSWESWHWRWIGSAAVRMQNEFFDGSQQLLLEFWDGNAGVLAGRHITSQGNRI